MTSNYESNLKEVEAALKKAVGRTLEGIGLFVVQEAQMRCPFITKNLLNSIHHQTDERDRKVVIGTPVEYAPYVELGTSKSAKQPFLRPAVEDNLGRIKDLAAELLRP